MTRRKRTHKSRDTQRRKRKNNFRASRYGKVILLQRGGGLAAKLEDDLLDTLKVNWTFWPAFHVLNFRFVAPPDRILYINAVQVLYNVFLVLKAAKRGNAKDVKTKE